MKGLNNKRSADMFEGGNVMLKTVNSAICETLCNVFKKCFYLKYFPEILKTSKVTTCHKIGCQANPINYRSISLLLLIGSV